RSTTPVHPSHLRSRWLVTKKFRNRFVLVPLFATQPIESPAWRESVEDAVVMIAATLWTAASIEN
ncbi:MAG: hypothetical protein ACR2IV_13065, partial [Bryobacteraceae bacterium]